AVGRYASGASRGRSVLLPRCLHRRAGRDYTLARRVWCADLGGSLPPISHRAAGVLAELISGRKSSGTLVLHDGLRPQFDFGLSQRAVRLEPPVVIAEPSNILQILLAGQQRSPAQPRGGGRVRRYRVLRVVSGQAASQLLTNTGRDPISRIGIDVAEQNDVTEEHAPMLAKPRQEMVPIEHRRERANEVKDVCPIEPLTLLNERLRPDHLFRRAQTERKAEDLHV